MKISILILNKLIKLEDNNLSINESQLNFYFKNSLEFLQDYNIKQKEIIESNLLYFSFLYSKDEVVIYENFLNLIKKNKSIFNNSDIVKHLNKVVSNDDLSLYFLSTIVFKSLLSNHSNPENNYNNYINSDNVINFIYNNVNYFSLHYGLEFYNLLKILNKESFRLIEELSLLNVIISKTFIYLGKDNKYKTYKYYSLINYKPSFSPFNINLNTSRCKYQICNLSIFIF